MDKLSSGLAKLGNKVHAKSMEAKSRKAADWKAVCDNHPDVAEHIREFSSVFGVPASLKVTENDGTVILNSEWYDR